MITLNVRRDVRRTNKNRKENTRKLNFDICPNCGAVVEGGRFDCPECGVVVKVPPRRKVEAKRDHVATAESENMNGKYNIYILSDGSLFCDCRAFLLQKRVWVEKEKDQLICKHIQKIFDQISQNLKKKGKPLTEWQKVLFKKLNIEPHPSLTREQAYWIIRELIAKMDMEYGEFVRLLKKNPNIELMSLTSYGLELEGLVRNRQEFYEKLKELGYKVLLTGYSHDMENELWKVGDDGSVRRSMSNDERNNYQSVELTTPKLYAVDGLKKVKEVLDIWNKLGAAVNNSCGFHVHVDAYGFSQRELARLLLVWLKLEPVIYFLVSPSRRDNSYARFWRRANLYNLARMILGQINGNDRYHALNLVAFKKYRTIEFRIHQGTTNFEKVKNWTLFCLKLVEKVKSGLKWYDFSEEPTIEEVLDKLGITENSVPILQNARKFLIERYNHFREGNQNHDLPSFDPDALKSMLSLMIDEIYGSLSLVTYIGDVSSTHYAYLANYRPRVLYSYEAVKRAQQGNMFIFPTEKRKFKVEFNKETGEISCNCSSFRQHQKCSHSISVARFIYLNEKYKDLVPYIENLDF